MQGHRDIRALAVRALAAALIIAALAFWQEVQPPLAEAAERQDSTSTGLEGRISQSGDHGCAVRINGRVHCWGLNHGGQLGNNTFIDSHTPVRVCGGPSCTGAEAALTGVKAVTTGLAHTCALLATGTVKCWGWNGVGQLGDGTTTARETPVDVAGLSNVVKVDAGAAHTCALTADLGRVYCWGYGLHGMLGNGGTADSHVPVQVCHLPDCSSHLAGVTDIAAGEWSSCAIHFGGWVRCWGNEDMVGSPGGDALTPRDVCSGPSCVGGEATLVRANKLADGAGCALRAGDIWCWPQNQDYASQLTSGGGYDAISGHAGQGCGTSGSGLVRCWGDNLYGQLGDGTTTPSATPVTVCAASGCPALFFDGVAVTAGGYATCSISGSGLAYCWGNGASGQLGNGGFASSSLPVQVLISYVGVRGADQGEDHTCVSYGNGEVHCVGNNDDGQLGNGTFVSSTSLVKASLITKVANLSTGLFHNCSNTGQPPRCWGRGDDGRLGNGSTVDQPSPTAISGGLAYSRMSAGSRHSCGYRGTTVVTCWGLNLNGRLGDGTTTDSLTPVTVAFGAGPRPTSIDAGESHTCARMDDHTAQCWGWNFYQQIGDGTAVDRHTPTTVMNGASPLIHVTAVAAGGHHSCALHAHGTVGCWGENGYGQLGRACGPVCDYGVLPDISNAIGISVGYFHSCALIADGTVKCWGWNDFGQLGNGFMTSSTTPVTVVLPRPAVAVSAGASVTSCAVLDNGVVTCWGKNDHGQTGIGTAGTPETLPKPMLIDSDGDGAPDGAEGFYGTDILTPNRPDDANDMANGRSGEYVCETPPGVGPGATRDKLRSDIARSGFVTATDLASVIANLDEGVPFPTVVAARSDVNCNGFVTATDLAVVIANLD